MNELGDEAKLLIHRVGTADGPSVRERARVKRRIVASLASGAVTFGGGGSVAAGAPAFGAASATKVTITSFALWLAAGAGLGAVASAPAVVSAYRRAEAVRVATPPAAPVRGAPREVAGETPAAALPAGALLAPPSRATEESAPPDRPRAAASTGAASLAEETRLLQGAQRELARRQANAALGLLDEHASRFPNGALAEERTAARVFALCDLGRTAEARSASEAFVRVRPHSPLVPRLRASCAGKLGADGAE